MRIRDFDFSRSPAELFAVYTKPTFGEPARHHAEADPPELYRLPGLQPGAYGPVHNARTFLPELLQQRLGERGRPSETHHGKGRRRRGLREGELHKPDLITYIVMCLLLFLLVLLIVFFINCQLRNSFFASMPYDRSLREARTSYK